MQFGHADKISISRGNQRGQEDQKDCKETRAFRLAKEAVKRAAECKHCQEW